MNRVYSISLIIFVALFIYSCAKVEGDINDYYPEIKTVTAIILPDGSFEVKGEIVSEGASPIKYVGVCMKIDTIPTMLDKQVIVDSVINNQFSVVYLGIFNENKRYYFRTWITNEYGYSYGNVVYIDK